MELEELRRRLSELDRKIIELIAERHSVVEEVGSLKRAEGRDTRDFAREKQVLDSAREQAETLGIEPRFAEEVMRVLIRSSLTRQERARVRAEGQGQGQKALVIGGSGKMGIWFVDFLASQGYDITVADPAGAADGFESVADWRATEDEFSVTVIAAPLRVTAEILEEMAGNRRNGLIFDIGSLKSPLVEGLRKLAATGAQVTSVHPMFGPDAQLLSDKHILFLDAGVPEATQQAQALFNSTMIQQTEMELEQHDRLVAYVLGLSHALNIAFFSVLARSGEDVPKLATLSSTTFDAQLEVASRVAQENPRLYFEIQYLNEFGPEPLDSLLQAVQKIADSVRSGDEDAFVKLMEQGQEYFARRG
ncbi:MAG: prephenate dehydrogenase/arogenate dehydrogenase family protein [Gammaproteobacteria bacterium]